MKSSRRKSLAALATKYLYGASGALYLFTFGLFRGTSRAYIAEVAQHFGWKDPERSHQRILPAIDPKASFPGGPAIEIHDPVSDDGNVSLLELVVLNTLVKRKNPDTLFEFGTFDGRTACNFAANSKDGARIFTIDLPQSAIAEARQNPKGDRKFVGKVENGYKFKGTRYAAKITQLLGDSATFDYRPYKKSIDFIFIDGAHSYAYVKSDTENAFSMLRAGGIVAWHDYAPSCEGVTRYINKLYEKGGIWKNLRSVKGTALALLVPDSILETLRAA